MLHQLFICCRQNNDLLQSTFELLKPFYLVLLVVKVLQVSVVWQKERKGKKDDHLCLASQTNFKTFLV